MSKCNIPRKIVQGNVHWPVTLALLGELSTGIVDRCRCMKAIDVRWETHPSSGVEVGKLAPSSDQGHGSNHSLQIRLLHWHSNGNDTRLRAPIM